MVRHERGCSHITATYLGRIQTGDAHQKEKTKQLKALTEDIAEAEVELRRQEALGEMWQNRKFDLIEYQRQQLLQIEEKIQNGPLGLRLLDLGKQIKDYQFWCQIICVYKTK